jgi:3-oxoacyl-[acyl-carrier protein] reductase
MIAVNLTSAFIAANAVAPIMKQRGGGKIITVSSAAGVIGVAQHGVYSATKFGLIGMTRALAVELAPHGINVNALAPGNTVTPANHALRTDPSKRDALDYMTSRTPSRRAFSPAEEMARAALFMASDEGNAMYGSTMLLDEGLTAGI